MSDFASSDFALLRRDRLLIAASLAPLLLGLLSLTWSASFAEKSAVVSVVAMVGVLFLFVGVLLSLFVMAGGSLTASSDVALLRRIRVLLAAALAPFLLGPLSLAWGVAAMESGSGGVGWLIAGIFCVIIGVLSLSSILWKSPSKIAVLGAFSVDDDSVRFAGRMLASRRSLRAGFLIPTVDQPPLVRLERRWPNGPIELQARDEPSGRALLRALGFDASQVIASFTFASRARADGRLKAVGCLTPMVALFGLPMIAAALPSMLSGLAILILGWMVLMWMPTRVSVGADGVLVSWFWRKRFLGYGELRGLEPFVSWGYRGVALLAAAGEPLKLPFKPGMSEQDTILIIQRIEQAMASFHQESRERDVALPERGGRSLEEWIRLLRAVGSGANADHRTAPISLEELFRVVEDPSAAPTERARAAVAIGGGLDDRGRARLRIAAEATAAPEIRALIELSAEEADEAQIAEAFEQLQGSRRQTVESSQR
jgi:hypothetical protein